MRPQRASTPRRQPNTAPTAPIARPVAKCGRLRPSQPGNCPLFRRSLAALPGDHLSLTRAPGSKYWGIPPDARSPPNFHHDRGR